MSFDVERLYGLLPAIHRIRDAEKGEPLKALMTVIADQIAVIEEDLAQRYDDHFIETCAPWVVPYLGDLVGTTPLFDAKRVVRAEDFGVMLEDLTGPSFIPAIGLSERADVARTIYFRRRKATRPMLEELGRLVTGWAVHVEEFFQRLGWTQCIRNHIVPERLFSPDLRSIEPIDRVNGPFDSVAHTADVRPIGPLEGWYNIMNVGFFVWRLGSFRITRGMARRVGSPGDYRFHVSPLEIDAPLFSQWVPRGDAAGLAEEPLTPGPIRKAAFFAHPADYYGPGSSLEIVRDGVPVPRSKVQCMDLTNWAQPTGQVVGVDVVLGRLSFGAGWEPTKGVNVDYHFGFSAGLGGGPYGREAWIVRPKLASLRLTVPSVAHPTLASALQAWEAAKKPNTIIHVAGNGTLIETNPISIEPADGRWLVIEAEDRARPHLVLTGPLEITGQHPTSGVTLSGLLIEGTVHVAGALGRLRLLHTTLVPGSSPSISVEPGPKGVTNAGLRVEIGFSITGPLRIPEHVTGLWIADSICDGAGSSAIASPISGPIGPPAHLERVTIFGDTSFESLEASEVIFTGLVSVIRRQDGCMRFSYVPPGSNTPRRFRCQPDLEISDEIEIHGNAKAKEITEEVDKWLVPSFTSLVYGKPEYAQLHLSCPTQISQGAEDGSEMGAFAHLEQPQRAANLRFRLKEYLPFGLEPGILFVT